MGNTSVKSSRSRENIVFPMAGTVPSRAPSAIHPSESQDLDDIDEYIRNDLARLNCNSTASSGSSRPSIPVLPSPDIVQQPDRDGDTAPRMVQFSEEGPFVTPGALTNRAYMGASRFPYPSNEPYRMIVEEPVNRESDIVAPVAKTSRASGSTKSASRQASNKPREKTVKKPQNHRREVVVPVASTSRDCAGAGSVSRQDGNKPTVEIVEQPVPSRRFRYDKELDSVGAIQGVRRTKGRKSFPKIKIVNDVPADVAWNLGPADITVSLVCKNPPYRVHPNGIVGKKKTPVQELTYIHVEQVEITSDNCVIEFDHLGIRYVRSDQIEKALRLREEQNIDPFGQGFSHEFDPKTDDLQAVRLCFQVKLAQGLKLDPVVSNVIYHSKNVGCLKIDKVIQTCMCRVSNTDELKVILKSRQINPKDVEVVFYESDNGEVWEHCVREFEVSDTRGIVCAVPHYPRASVDNDTVVKVALRRPSDGTCGDPMPFTYYADVDAINERKRKKKNNLIQQYVQNNWTPPTSLPPDNDSQNDQDWRNKLEPFDVNPPRPEPSSVYPTVSGLNHHSSAIPRPSRVKSVVPVPSSVNYAVPGQSSVSAATSRLNHDNSAMPRPSHINSAVSAPNYSNPFVAGSSSVNYAVPGQSSVNAATSRLNHDNSAMPRPSHINSAVSAPNYSNPVDAGPSSVNYAVPGQSSVNAAISRLNHVNSVVPGPSFINLDVPRRSHLNLAIPAPNSLAGVLGPNQGELAVSEPDFTTSSVSGLNYLSHFSPGPTKWEPMQTNLSMSPDMPMPPILQPMSVSEDEGFYSPNGHLNNDGKYPGEDSPPVDVCYNLIEID